ncbi:MAG: hypothetical protein HOP19_21040, partial [Acidobacteria bacterium]|nr:hypothetical protein [Acidobacteriota bacterium]
MKKLLVFAMFAIALFFASGFIASAQPRPDFSGTWSLDLKKSGEIPTALKSYLLTVKQDGQQITIDAKLEGDINPVTLTDHTAPQPGAIPLATATATANPENVEGSSGGTHKIVQARGRALAMVIRHLNCTLDGKEMAREMGGLTPGQIRRKAQWRKGDKSLEINLTRDFDFQGSKFTSTVREQWQLSEDGKTLKIKRTVNLLAGYDETML